MSEKGKRRKVTEEELIVNDLVENDPFFKDLLTVAVELERGMQAQHGALTALADLIYSLKKEIDDLKEKE